MTEPWVDENFEPNAEAIRNQSTEDLERDLRILQADNDQMIPLVIIAQTYSSTKSLGEIRVANNRKLIAAIMAELERRQ